MHNLVARVAKAPLCPAMYVEIPGNENDQAFISLLDLYRGSGGLARAQEVFIMFKSRNDLGVAALAGWIAHRTVLCLQWSTDVWLPLFQFELQCMTVKPDVQPVYAALIPLLTPWELAHWFAKPHKWLDGDSPANALDADGGRVLRVACADRFLLQ